MERQGVRINDLHAFMAPRQKEMQIRPGDVHFTPAGYKALAAEVAKQIEAALAK